MTAEIVRNIRYAWGVTQPEFARLLGVSTRTVSGWENGEPMTTRTLVMFEFIEALGYKKSFEILSKLSS